MLPPFAETEPRSRSPWWGSLLVNHRKVLREETGIIGIAELPRSFCCGYFRKRSAGLGTEQSHKAESSHPGKGKWKYLKLGGLSELELGHSSVGKGIIEEDGISWHS